MIVDKGDVTSHNTKYAPRAMLLYLGALLPSVSTSYILETLS